MPEKTLEKIAALLNAKNDGLGELSSKAARACAALNGSLSVTEEHVKMAVMSLRHRLRRDPLDESSSDTVLKNDLEVFD